MKSACTTAGVTRVTRLGLVDAIIDKVVGHSNGQTEFLQYRATDDAVVAGDVHIGVDVESVEICESELV